MIDGMFSAPIFVPNEALDDLRKRFEAFMTECCKGEDAGKLRFVVE